MSLDGKHDRNLFKLELKPGQDSVALLVNNLGSTTSIEMGILVSDAIKCLKSKNIAVLRVYSGLFMTSLEMAGFSISLLKVTPEILPALDLKVGASAWSFDFCHDEWLNSDNMRTIDDNLDQDSVSDWQYVPMTTSAGKIMAKIVAKACVALVENEELITNYDKIAGDGGFLLPTLDCGTTLARGAKAILDQISQTSSVFPFDSPSLCLSKISLFLEHNMGGSSGALFCLFLMLLPKSLILLTPCHGRMD